jgi:AcrR family transcriptional regulator
MPKAEKPGRRGRKTSNREKIFHAAVTMMADRGYEHVSLRDIASAAGIKAGSIYNHFHSKAAILDAVVEIFRGALKERSMNEGPEDIDAALRGREPRELLTDIMLAPLALLEEPSLRELVRVVSRGQYHHAGIRDFLAEEMFGRPLALLVRVMRRFTELGLLETYPPEFLAAEIQAPMTANFYRLSLGAGAPRADPAETRRAMRMHVDFFWKAAKKL